MSHVQYRSVTHRRILRGWLLAIAWVMLQSGLARADVQLHTDGVGRIMACDVQGQAVDIQGELQIHGRGWKTMTGMTPWHAKLTGHKASEQTRTWQGSIHNDPRHPDGPVTYTYDQTIDQSKPDQARLSLKLTSKTALPIEAVFYAFKLPVAQFQDGQIQLINSATAANKAPHVTTLPVTLPEDYHFAGAVADQIVVRDKTGKITFTLKLKTPVQVNVQDDRKWNQPWYQVNLVLADATFTKGKRLTLDAQIAIDAPVDHAPVLLKFKFWREFYRFDGFGGTYCFDLASPVTRYTLDHLNFSWSRLEMKLWQWAPRPVRIGGKKTGPLDQAALARHDQPGTELRRTFQIAQELDKRGVRYVMSIWQLPPWMYKNTSAKPGEQNQEINPEQWDDLLACITGFLQYAKKHYGVVPVALSFNETDSGVMVRFTPEEYRQMVLRVGAKLAEAGLKTRVMIGDVVVAPHGLDFIKPTLNDPAAMRYVNIIAFHSWNGATPEQYRAWSKAARDHQLPLLVTELGVDADWRSVAGYLDSWWYAQKEMAMYQDILQYAQPAGTMAWEFTGDYALVHAHKGKFTPTYRYALLSQLCRWTPQPAAVYHTSSNQPQVRFTGFGVPVEVGEIYSRSALLTLHILNTGPSRPATIKGLPSWAYKFRVITTDQKHQQLQGKDIEVDDQGELKLQLPASSLTTLTAGPPGWKKPVSP